MLLPQPALLQYYAPRAEVGFRSERCRYYIGTHNVYPWCITACAQEFNAIRPTPQLVCRTRGACGPSENVQPGGLKVDALQLNGAAHLRLPLNNIYVRRSLTYVYVLRSSMPTTI